MQNAQHSNAMAPFHIEKLVELSGNCDRIYFSPGGVTFVSQSMI
jgi:hypothetical protein